MSKNVVNALIEIPWAPGTSMHSIILSAGDPLDILVIVREPTVPGCVVPARVLGYLATVDNGCEDYKRIAAVNSDPRYDHVQKPEDLADHDLEVTLRVIDECTHRYLFQSI